MKSNFNVVSFKREVQGNTFQYKWLHNRIRNNTPDGFLKSTLLFSLLPDAISETISHHEIVT